MFTIATLTQYEFVLYIIKVLALLTGRMSIAVSSTSEASAALLN
jgi:hypothetical protein